MALCEAYAPVKPDEGRLISGFGTRTGRTTGAPTFHAGIDILGSRGTAVYAPRAGTVSRLALNSAPIRSPFGGYGNAVVLEHPHDGVWTMFAHLDEPLVHPGDTVYQGQQIGTIGNTTNGKFPGMGVHLHMEVRRARQDGSAPFPGRYGAFNLDPVEWLTEKGLRFGPVLGRTENRGAIDTVGEPTACPPPPVYPARLPTRPNTSGLRGLAVLDDGGDENALYEPPVPDPWLFDRPVEAWAYGIVAAPLILLGAIGFHVATR
jgi:murein DD-endopeptidase MepM/ murein hydrolase activator NlpD